MEVVISTEEVVPLDHWVDVAEGVRVAADVTAPVVDVFSPAALVVDVSPAPALEVVEVP